MNTARFILLLLLLAPLHKSPAQTREDIRQVTSVYNEISAIVNKGKFEDLGRFIYPGTGVIEIIDPDGIPYPILHPDAGLAKLQGLFISAPVKTPEEATLPEFDCNIGMWTRTGTFISGVKGYPLLEAILPGAEEVSYIDKRLLGTLNFLKNEITVVVMTTGESVLGFYKKEGVWWLGVVDNSFNCVE